MALEGGIALLWILSFAVSATSLEFQFNAVDRNPPKTYDIIEIPFGSNVTLTCRCRNCKTIDFMKNGKVNINRFYSVSTCKAVTNKTSNKCDIHSFNTTIVATSQNNNSKWFCRGVTNNEEHRASQVYQFIINGKPVTRAPSTPGSVQTNGTGLPDTSENALSSTIAITAVTVTSTGNGSVTKGPGLQNSTHSNQSLITAISAVIAVLVVTLGVTVVILCRKKWKQKLVSRLNNASQKDNREVKDSTDPRTSICIMEENVIYESSQEGCVNQESDPEVRKSLCVMEANPLYEST